MCIGYPGRVVRIEDGVATVDDGERRRRATTLLLPDVGPGAWVLVAAGTIVRELEPDDAADLARQLARATSMATPTDPAAAPTAGTPSTLRPGGTP